jgi:hypothetical protein
MERSPTSATGTGWERMPWHATQRAAWEALKHSRRQAMILKANGEKAPRLRISNRHASR